MPNLTILTTRQRSHLSNSFCAEFKTSGSRDSPNQTTWGRSRPEHFEHLIINPFSLSHSVKPHNRNKIYDRKVKQYVKITQNGTKKPLEPRGAK